MKSGSRIEIAKDTLELIEKGFYRNNLGELISIETEVESAIKNSQIFRPKDFPKIYSLKRNLSETQIKVTDETTLEAAKRVCKEDASNNPFVLNFASAKNPGGGFLSGAQAQEESLARSSGIYPCLTANFEMYEFNRRVKSCFYSDYMIYSPKVVVFRNDDGSLLTKPYLVSILTSPAVNAGVVKQKEPEKVELIREISIERARKFLWLANEKRHQILILGAWGCGVFQNDPKMIAKMFVDLLNNEFRNCFEQVIFAVYDTSSKQRIFQDFKTVFDLN
jgi:uncharacterized protein (TIGR02452 family)